MLQDLTDDKSTLVQVMTWCRQATHYYLSQCRLSSLSPYGVARPQWVKASHYWPFVRGIHCGPVDSPHKGPVMQWLFPCHDVMYFPVSRMAPEVILCETEKDNPYDYKADIWSLGKSTGWSDRSLLCWIYSFKKHKNIFTFSIISQYWDGVIPLGRQWSIYHAYRQYCGCYWPGDARSQSISSHGIDLAILDYSDFNTKMYIIKYSSQVMRKRSFLCTQVCYDLLMRDVFILPQRQWSSLEEYG